MQKRDLEYRADKGKHFVLTEFGKANSKTYSGYEVGKPVDSEETWCPAWAIDEGYLEEVDDPDWVTMTGYRAVYDVHEDGKYIFDCGNHYVFPDKEMAEYVAKEFNNRPYRNRKSKAYVVEDVYEGKRPKENTEYEGKTVFSIDYWCYDRPIGSLVQEEVVDDLINSVPPKSMRRNCMQGGECADTVQEGNRYPTFKQVAENVYEWCGNCLRGQNVSTGTELQYVGC